MWGGLIDKGGSPNNVILSEGLSKWPSVHKGLLTKLEVSFKHYSGEVPEVPRVGSSANFDISAHA